MTIPQVFFLIALGTLPSLGWLWFYLKKDQHPEPKKLLLLTFLGGAIITIPVALIELELSKVITQTTLLFLAAASVEELAKLFIFWSFFLLRRHPALDEPVDAMIYLVTAALGFAAAENIGNLLKLGNVGAATYLALMAARFLGATLLHSLTSAILGFYLAQLYFKLKLKGTFKNLLWIKGLTFAILIHLLFNLFISQAQTQNSLLNVIFVVILLTGGMFIVAGEFKRLTPKIALTPHSLIDNK